MRQIRHGQLQIQIIIPSTHPFNSEPVRKMMKKDKDKDKERDKDGGQIQIQRQKGEDDENRQ